MNKVIPIREPEQNVLEMVEDSKHRVDVMAYRVVEEICKKEPVLESIFANVKGPLADFLNQKLGPEPVEIKPRRRRRTRKVPT